MKVENMMKNKNSYKYIKENSILKKIVDEYNLTLEEYYLLHSFYVTYSLCDNQSAKKRTFVDYGWSTNKINDTELGIALSSVLNLNRNPEFLFVQDDIGKQFQNHDLKDRNLINIEIERAVMVKSSENNNYLRFFHRIRNGLAHGKYCLCYSKNQEKMIIIQDDDTHNVTARIVVRLSTLLNFIIVVDRNNILLSKNKEYKEI